MEEIGRHGLGGGIFSELHEAVGAVGWLEAEFGVDGVGVPGGEHPVVDVGESGVFEGEFNKGFGEALAAVSGINEDVRDPGEAGAVGDDTGVGDLSVGRRLVREGVVEGADDKRGVLGGLLDFFEGNAGRPIGVGKPVVDFWEVESGGVVGDLVVMVGKVHRGIIAYARKGLRRFFCPLILLSFEMLRLCFHLFCFLISMQRKRAIPLSDFVGISMVG